ncbi:diphosphate--fructose-6-phosphate 1-phosphotransferase [Chelativorans sp. Marseille-P2723]|uniref:diphosphate--fructose-6-phosphate 1-phosphotransferase n=1 Tax=Chelativorans sp. Marseille-P2723 TaxID=2709133 RepID=UPI00156F40E1|nr:diphosphate--fructose-6-phosphate 1-phosphotransferase [Chelativorans sp. Marseille-P2723]
MGETFVIAQGGGPTAVINQTVAGAVLEARRRFPKARVLGALHGVRGVRDNRLVMLSDLPEERLRAIAGTPSAALGSTRDKPDEAYCEAIVKGLTEVGADGFIYIGGNDTAGTQQLLNEASGGRITCVHAPKTIDNDLEENDHTPGFISAAEFVAGAFLSIDLDFMALPGIYVGIVMGRHSGFLTASAAAWSLGEEAGPHLIYVPERPFERASFVEDVKATFARHGRCIVAMSEGVSTADGRSLVETLVPPELQERDQHGNLRLSGSDLGQTIEHILAEELPGRRARVDTFGYLPRGNIATINATDAREAFEAGQYAIEAMEKGGGSVALQWNGKETRCKLVPLSSVAGRTRQMPHDFLHEDESGLTEAGLAYLSRLLPRKYQPAPPFT